MASVDGLVTGMNTTDTINQLMQVEAVPQTALKTKITAQNKAVAAYQSVNSRLAASPPRPRPLGSADTWGAHEGHLELRRRRGRHGQGRAPPPARSASRVDKLAADAHGDLQQDRRSPRVTDADRHRCMTGSTFDVLLADGSSHDAHADRQVAPVGGRRDQRHRRTPRTRRPPCRSPPGKYTLQLTATDSRRDHRRSRRGRARRPASTTSAAPTVTTRRARRAAHVGTRRRTVHQSPRPRNTFTDVLPGVTVTATKDKQPATRPSPSSVAPTPTASPTRCRRWSTTPTRR